MPPRFDPEALDHYVAGVFDDRIVNLFDAKPPQEKAFVFAQGVLDFPEPEDTFLNHYKPTRSVDKVNGLTQVGYWARDGEVSSGYINAITIETPTAQVLAAVRSFAQYHWDGMPIADRTWVCEFDQVDDMRSFLEAWTPDFDIARATDAIASVWGGDERYDFHNPSALVRLYQTGLLKPWFSQAPGDRLFADGRFSTSGAVVSDLFNRLQGVPGYELGRVLQYAPQSERYRSVPSRIVRTCLGGFRHTTEPGNMFDRRDRSNDVMVQWVTGELELFWGDDTEYMPKPVTPAELGLEKSLAAK